MTTWTEMEKEIELQLRACAQALDEMEAEDNAREAELQEKIKAAGANVRADLQAKAAKLDAAGNAQFTLLEEEMNALVDIINATAARLDAENEQASERRQADLEARQAKMRADREKVTAQLKASYKATVKHIQNIKADLKQANEKKSKFERPA
jgi:hypothetical protein